MEKKIVCNPIGTVHLGEEGYFIQLFPTYHSALLGLSDFSHLEILWFFSGCENPADRSTLIEEKPYQGGPDTLGVFATRSPRRPNPIALSCAAITFLDVEAGLVGLSYIDADPGSPVLDLKPYTPSLDRVESPSTPAWCAHWPQSLEASGDFDWDSVFHF